MSALIQQTDEWLEFRKCHIGASDAPIIMGVSPWTTPYQLWLEKLSLAEPKKKERHMIDGIRKEDMARDCFEKMTGIFVLQDIVLHPKIEWMMASLDGIDIERKNIVEIKCPGKIDHERALQGKVPHKYYPQIQHQLEVCELNMAHYFSYDGNTGVVLKVYRDDKYIKNMLEYETEFWGCMQNFLTPKMSQKDFNQKNDDVWKSTAIEWISINKQMKELYDKEKELRELLITMSDNQNCIGGGIRVSKTVRRGQVEYSNIPEIENVDLEKYRKGPVECWKIIQAK